MLVIGQKYRVNRQQLNDYIDAYNWDIVMCQYDSITVKEIIKSDDSPLRVKLNCYVAKEINYFYPEDCLYDDRNNKLNRVL
jgi:hypothetical protein